MKNIRPFALLLFVFAISSPALAQAGSSVEPKTATLYSPIPAQLRHEKPQPKLCLSLSTGKLVSRFGPRWDICYGYMYLGNDLDWLEVAPNEESRTVIKDLGRHGWNDSFKIAALEPLPKLKPGEHRQLIIGTSGKNPTNRDHTASMNPYQVRPERIGRGPLRADGHGVDADEGVEWIRTIPLDSGESTPRRKQHKNPPVLAQAALNHIYEIHVVNEQGDYYVLLRVDALTRGDNCTVSWKRVPTPQ